MFRTVTEADTRRKHVSPRLYDAVELITLTDKDTREQKRRFKCQSCGKCLAKAF